MLGGLGQMRGLARESGIVSELNVKSVQLDETEADQGRQRG
jgi:hypothetical protein